MTTPENLKFMDSHEWIESGTETAAVGISDHAQSELSDVVFVELPEAGRQVTANETVAVVESVKAASDIYAPVSGEIVAVNTELENDPSIINSSPYEKGWLFKIKPSNPAEFDQLKNAEAYAASLGE